MPSARSLGFRIVNRFDDGALAVANAPGGSSRALRDHRRALSRRDNAALSIGRIDQQIAVVDRRIEHLGFCQIDFALAVERQEPAFLQRAIERDPFVDALHAVVGDQRKNAYSADAWLRSKPRCSSEER